MDRADEQQLAMTWEKPSEGLELNLGCGRNPEPGWLNVDERAGFGIDVTADLELSLPWSDNSVKKIRMIHVFEHIKNTLGLMEELHRVAKPNAILLMKLPYGSSDAAWEDPTHVRPYFLHSFGFFSQPYYARADYNYRGDWQPVQIDLTVSKSLEGTEPQELVERVFALRNIVTEMTVVLKCVKPIREPKQQNQIYPTVKFIYL